MFGMERHEVTTLRKLDCTERDECPGRHKLAGVEGSFIVAKRVSWRHRWALRKLAGPGEKITWAPDALFDPYPEEA